MNTANRYKTPSKTHSAKKLRREKTTLSTNSDSGKDPVHVYCRLKPLKENAETSIKLVSADTLALTTSPDVKGIKKEIHYKFKHIFTAYSSQKEVFDHVAFPLLQDLLKGINGLLFSYGVTGSGKTYTLNGEPNDPGIMPRCIDTIFNSIGDYQTPKFLIKSDRMNGFEVQTENDAMEERLQVVRSASKTPRSCRKLNGDRVSYVNDGTKIPFINDNNLYAVFVNYIEIYNNRVFDLLDDALDAKLLREDSQKAMYVAGVTEVEVKSAEEAFQIFRSGQNRKKIGATLLNAESSRSHSIFNIRIVQLERDIKNLEGQPVIPDRNLITVGQLSLVDLAGSERTNRTQNVGERLREASSINNSLMTLRTCLEVLRENQLKKANRPVPYRDSRLTLLFKNYFEGGEGSVQMIVCINPSKGDLEENVHVLKFAEITQDVKILKAEPKLTPLLKKTISKTATTTPTPMMKIRKKATEYSVLPEIPLIKFNLENLNECGIALEKISKILKLRKEKGRIANKEFEEKKKDFRKRLVEINQENILSKTELRSLKTVVHKEKQKIHNLQTKLNDKETENNSLQIKMEELHDVIRSQQNVINEKDLKINRNVLEKEKTKQKLALVSEKMSQDLDAKLKRQREHLNAEMKAKDQKLKKMKELLECDMPPIDITAIEPDHAVILQTPKVASHESRSNVAAASTPRRRRSRSAGETWIEHNVIKPVPLGTVLQPTMKKRKSITKLSKASDITNPKTSKYCLIAQDQDTDGEVETKLYKADIVPTCGGGAQVIFNDVERLKQESPTH